jgi:chromosome segregation ATPase
MKEKDIMLDSLRRQINEAREDLHQREADLDRAQRRQIDDDRDRGALERKEKSKLQKEMEVLERNYAELEQ